MPPRPQRNLSEADQNLNLLRGKIEFTCLNQPFQISTLTVIPFPFACLPSLSVFFLLLFLETVCFPKDFGQIPGSFIGVPGSVVALLVNIDLSEAGN